MSGPSPAAAASWIDTKDLLLKVLMGGYQAQGFGIESTQVAPVDDSHPTLSFLRAMGQSSKPRPLLTVMREGGSARSAWLSNYGAPEGYTSGGSAPAGALPIDERFRIQIEAFDDTGGMPMVDWLLETADGILLSYYDTLTWPVEAGGYGLYFPSWALGADTERPFTEVGGKVIFANYILFTCTRILSTQPPTPGTPWGGFVIEPTTDVQVSTSVYTAAPIS